MISRASLQAIPTDPHADLPACAGCARCCHLVVELKEGVDHVPEEWVAEHGGVRFMDQYGDGRCVALDPVSRLCRIYEDRPAVCRQFDRGGVLCRQILFGGPGVRLRAGNGLGFPQP